MNRFTDKSPLGSRTIPLAVMKKLDKTPHNKKYIFKKIISSDGSIPCFYNNLWYIFFQTLKFSNFLMNMDRALKFWAYVYYIM